MKINILLSVLFITCLIQTGNGQTPIDTVLIKKAWADSTTENSYVKLIKKFNEAPQFLYPNEGSIIYYGKLFDSKYNAFNSLISNKKLNEFASKQKFKEAIIEGEKLLRDNPSSLKILFILLASYIQTKNEEKVKLTRDKLSLLQKAILQHGTGDSETNTIKVTSAEDEYVLMGMMNIHSQSRSSKSNGKSIFDIWNIQPTESGQKKLIFEVLYGF